VPEIIKTMKAEIQTGDSRLQVRNVTTLLGVIKCTAEMKE